MDSSIVNLPAPNPNCSDCSGVGTVPACGPEEPQDNGYTPCHTCYPDRAKLIKIDKLSSLEQFTGTNEWFRHGLVRDVTYTEGVKYVAEVAGAYWLIDQIAMAQWHPRLKSEPFQCWVLHVKGNSAQLLCDDGNGNKLVSRSIEYTDFPLETIKLFVADKVILLPGEY